MPRRLVTAHLTVILIAVFHLPGVANTFERAIIVNTAFTVKAGDAKYWNFRIGSDIKCLILDADSFENWRNGHKVRSYYSSEKITVANINVNLSEGDYVLVFDNTFSALSNKAVTANVEMRW
jgi:hypothetical protein